MSEDRFEETLEQWLAYPDPSADDAGRFVVNVMGRVQKEQRTRRLILFLFGSIGALFGALGAFLLSGTISWLFTEGLTATTIMQATLFIVGGAAFYIWFMNDDLALES